MSTAAQIKLVCEVFGLSRVDLARSLRIAPVTLKRWEEDRNDPVGLSREVLDALHLVAEKVTKDKRRAFEIGRRLNLGIGALLAEQLLQLEKARP